MVSPTRRSLLRGAAASAAVFAGCGGRLGGSSEASGDSRETTPTGPGSGSTTDPTTLAFRVDTNRPPIWLADPDGADGRPTANERDRGRELFVVDGPDRADRVGVADRVDDEQVRSFLDATAFDNETVLVERATIEECFELDLCRVSWSTNEISTDYARRVRPYTVRCEADARVVAVRLVRLPASLNADDVTGFSSSIGSGGCDPGPAGAEGEQGGEDG